MATYGAKEFNAEPSAPAAVRELPADITILPASHNDERQKLVSAKSPLYGQENTSSPSEGEEKICRCCHDETDTSDLIAPCACTGSCLKKNFYFYFQRK